MNPKIQSILTELNSRVQDDDFLDFADEKIDELQSLDARGDAIQELLGLIEKNPGVDFGMPGPLVHFVERFYRNGYEEKLIDSIRRAPVPHTLWMLNRIINGSQADERNSYVAELEAVLSINDLSNETRIVAKEFLDLHQM